jgi:hypothetical protein
MRPAIHHLSISAVRADALFASPLQRSDEPAAGQVREAIASAIREFGPGGCSGRVAQEFGDHPETAVLRMRWARFGFIAGAPGTVATGNTGQTSGSSQIRDEGGEARYLWPKR